MVSVNILVTTELTDTAYYVEFDIYLALVHCIASCVSYLSLPHLHEPTFLYIALL